MLSFKLKPSQTSKPLLWFQRWNRRIRENQKCWFQIFNYSTISVKGVRHRQVSGTAHCLSFSLQHIFTDWWCQSVPTSCPSAVKTTPTLAVMTKTTHFSRVICCCEEIRIFQTLGCAYNSRTQETEIREQGLFSLRYTELKARLNYIARPYSTVQRKEDCLESNAEEPR